MRNVLLVTALLLTSVCSAQVMASEAELKSIVASQKVLIDTLRADLEAVKAATIAAQATANDGVNRAINAQGTANTGVANAGAAQTAANNAQAAANTADNHASHRLFWKPAQAGACTTTCYADGHEALCASANKGGSPDFISCNVAGATMCFCFK